MEAVRWFRVYSIPEEVKRMPEGARMKRLGSPVEEAAARRRCSETLGKRPEPGLKSSQPRLSEIKLNTKPLDIDSKPDIHTCTRTKQPKPA